MVVMSSVDLVITNCRPVIPKIGIVNASIAVDKGVIVSVASESQLPKAEKVIDAGGNLVFPGVIDPHVHYGLINDLEQDVRTETESAALGGITTVLRFHRTEESYFNIFETEKKVFEDNSLTDFSFSYGLMIEKHLEELERYVEELGITSFKFYLNYQRGYFEAQKRGFIGIDDGFLYRGLRRIGALGHPALPCIHCENIEIIEGIRPETGGDLLADWSDSRPNIAEEESLASAVAMGRAVGCPIYVVHMTTSEAVNITREEKKSSNRVYAEACPPYLTFTKHDDLGLMGKLIPPLRNRADVEELWRGIRHGVIDTIGSDHSPKSLEMKKGGGDIWSATAGNPGSATLLPVMLSEGFHKRGIPLEKIVEVTSYNAARIFGLFPRKGTIAVGSDADFTIVDINKKVKVRPELLKSSSDFSLFDG